MQDAETTTAASAPWGEETTTRPLMGMNKQEPPGAKRETTSLSSALRAGSIGKPKKKEETTSPLYPWLETPLRAVQKQGIKETYRGTTTGPPAPWMSETTMRPLGPDNKVMKLSKPVAKKQKTPAPSPEKVQNPPKKLKQATLTQLRNIPEKSPVGASLGKGVHVVQQVQHELPEPLPPPPKPMNTKKSTPPAMVCKPPMITRNITNQSASPSSNLISSPLPPSRTPPSLELGAARKAASTATKMRTCPPPPSPTTPLTCCPTPPSSTNSTQGQNDRSEKKMTCSTTSPSTTPPSSTTPPLSSIPPTQPPSSNPSDQAIKSLETVLHPPMSCPSPPPSTTLPLSSLPPPPPSSSNPSDQAGI